MAFVMVLSFSRQIFLRFHLDARMENFLRGHVAAFGAWHGLPRVLLYDHLNSAVLERRADAIRFHPMLLEFAGHYRFEPRPVAVARGNEKGRVERAIRYVRDSFFAARTFTDVGDLNAQAERGCNGLAADRLCPEDRPQSVRTVFTQEQSQLLPLPDNPYPLEECVEVSIGKTPYARFDLNDYSIPHTHVKRTLTVRASLDEVRILEGTQILTAHPRGYDKGAQIELPEHIEALVNTKRAARQHRGTDQLAQAAPASQTRLAQAAQRGDNPRTITATLQQFLHDYGATELQAAIEEALQCGVPPPNAVRLALERRRHDLHVPPLVVTLPAHRRERDTHVKTHELESHDQLTRERGDE